MTDQRTPAQIADDMRGIEVAPGRTRGQLQDAFDLVRTKGDWKMPIDARLPADTDDATLALVDEAVVFFTGGTIETSRDADGVTVRSDGYYINIGS